VCGAVIRACHIAFRPIMTEPMEQRYCIKFCQRLGDSKVETIWKIQQAFGDDGMGATLIKEWFNCFKDACTLADSDQRSGRPLTSWNANVIENVRSLIMEDHRLTVREIADEVGISAGSAHSIEQRICTCAEWCQNLCPSCFHRSNNSSALRSHGTCWSVPTGILSS
jgi:hypothetical protein